MTERLPSSESLTTLPQSGALSALAERRVNTTTAGAQSMPQIAVLANGDYMVTWYGGLSQDADVWTQRYAPDGTPVGGETRVNTTLSYNQAKPAVAALADGGYVVVWQSDYAVSGGAGLDVYGQRFDAAGAKVGGEFRVNLNTTGDQLSPTVAGLAGGGFVVGFTDGSEVYARRFDAAGVAQGSDALINVSTANTQQNLRLLGLPNGTFAAVWQSDHVNGKGIYARLYTANGSPLTGEVLVSTTTLGYALEPSVALMQDGGFVVGWAQSLPTTRDVYVRRFDAAGSAVTAEIKVTNGGNGGPYRYMPSVSGLADGGFMLAWHSSSQDGSGYGVYGQRFDAANNKAGGEVLVNAVTADNQDSPAVAGHPNGGWIVAWNSNNQDGSGSGVYSRLYTPPVYSTFKGMSGTDTLTGSAKRDFIDGLEGNDTLLGLGDSDTISGGSGNDFLDGGIGGDILIGGTGDDIYVVDNVGDVVIEQVGEGTDEVRTGLAAYTLAAEVENLTYTGSGAFAGTGNASGNRITSGAGADTLDGGLGADTLAGGLGDDLYLVDNAGDLVQETAGGGTDTVVASVSVTLDANIEALVLTGTGNLNGTGNALDNRITGTAGANLLDGGAGADTLNGGAGNDVYVVADAGDVVIEAAGAGVDEIRTTLSAYTLGTELEVLTHIGSGAFSGTGNAAGNLLTGGGGADTLNGAGGADTLAGGLGDDVYVVDDAADALVEAANEGSDTVRTSLAAYTLGANLEHLTFTGAGAFAGTGNALANRLSGGDGADTLDGRLGSDTLVGGLGDDLYLVDDAGDVVEEVAGGGADTVLASVSVTLGAEVEALVLTGSDGLNGTGNALDNRITGNEGANILNGGGGADTLSGGAGADIFLFTQEGDSAPGAEDLILDFSQADGDRLDLSGINADATVAGNSAFTFIGEEAFTGVAGQLRFMAASGDTWLLGDTNGDGNADLKIVLRGSVSLTAGDVML